jgi:hypothetical protein
VQVLSLSACDAFQNAVAQRLGLFVGCAEQLEQQALEAVDG